MTFKRARIYDAFALLVVIVVIALDQWTKNLVVSHLSLNSDVPFPILGHYLAFDYIQNSGAAFSMFRGNLMLALLIIAAVVVVGALYARMLNTGPLIYKIVFGMIIGGALGNLLDRAFRGGAVVDFVSFRIPEINFYFAVFNVADACISIGVVLLFILVLFGGFGHSKTATSSKDTAQQTESKQS